MLTLQEISDRLEIQDLLVRYSNAIDRRDFDLLDQVFTPDAEIDYTQMGAIAGRYPEVKAWLGPALAQFPAFQHIIANLDITLRGDTASGRIVCFNPTAWPGVEKGQHIAFFGLWYVDEYVRTAQGWRICKRLEEFSYTHNVPVTM